MFMRQTYANWPHERKIEYWESKLLFLDKMQTQSIDGIGNFGLYILDSKFKKELLKYESNWEGFLRKYCEHFRIDFSTGERLCELNKDEEEWKEQAKK